MISTLLGSKQKMGQAFIEGTRVPVTWIKTGPCTVTQIKREEKDGYWAVQLGLGERKLKNTSKPLQGHFRKSQKLQDTLPSRQAGKIQNFPRHLREVRLEKEPEIKVGDTITVSDIFKKGDVVTIIGTSKGKGFAGVVKRWRFSGGPRTHGQSDRERAPGSIGQGTTPGRVLKGKKMAGRMGNERVTVKNLIVVDISPEENTLAVSGPVPGIPGNLLIVRKTAEGSLEELVEEAPQVEIQQVEPFDSAQGKEAEAEPKEGK
ncbi:50S ribosomal protein L3 [Candidatus Woesebacteria bacterium RIFCSPHIGHO2_01_FULL_38_9]|uniref:Large ribosomal subunit protein uL3 n=1 Tax=Candidatus Woesebacteria bacterium RIFCSPHIGHO2_01_FULL_38_9 TaxID=1802492 RepID=A0A1F7Y5D8_9BACT|nr:MAG: 50S ribosomal protein L3 [Candidatus Woesebacteria bacterium RIFCSPHIGHO2_01_FULL_38_9]